MSLTESSKAESDSLILDNLGLVHSLVKKFTNIPSSYLYQELYSEGLVGLTEAANRYKSGKAKFSTFAYIRIRGAILNYLQNNKSLIKTPWAQDKKVSFNFVSLLAANDEDYPNSQQREICDEESGYSSIDLLESIKTVLTEQEYSVLIMRYEGYTQLEISQKLGISVGGVNKLLSLIREAVYPIVK